MELGDMKQKSLGLKLKYLQVEPGARVKLHEMKNFMPDTEDLSTCCKVRVYKEGLISKGTTVGDDIGLPVTEPGEQPSLPPDEVKKEEVYDEKSFTGFFRNSMKRIDLMLVIGDDGNSKPDIEKFKMNYLISIIKTGLEVELENGLMDEHKNFLFIKVHAPDAVVEEYGEKLGVKKYFKYNHLEYIKPDNMYFNCKMCTFTNMKYEREWIEIVRRNYVKPMDYSNSERSLLVYKMLLYLPFDEYMSHFGLKRLLRKNIILDAYALHDGPYFFTARQDFTKTNGRQILFYNWVGCKNAFKMQPLHLITEYLGSRVGLYFAFLQYFNYGYLFALVGGVFMTIYGILDNTYAQVTKTICGGKIGNKTLDICPRCLYGDILTYQKSCPIWDAKKYYCLAAKLTAILDNNFIVVYALFMTIGASIFVAFWNRKENYLIWAWELYNIRKLPTTRVECVYDYANPPRSSRTGILKYHRYYLPQIIRAMNYVAIIFVASLLTLWLANMESSSFVYYVKKIINPEYPKSLERYIYVFYFAVLYFAVFIVYEEIFKILIKVSTYYENHRTEEAYERSLIFKRACIALSSIIFMFFYFSFFKGIIYKIQFDIRKYFGKYLFGHCDPVTCIDETCIFLLVIITLRIIIPKLFKFWIFCISPMTDYNQSKKIVQTIPIWEREYKLKAVTENYLTEKYINIILQFILVVFYAPALPLASLIMFVINLMDIRQNAREFLLNRRRPVLLETTGILTWKQIFTFLSFSAIITNGMLIGRNSRAAKKHYVLKTLQKNMTEFFSSIYAEHWMPYISGMAFDAHVYDVDLKCYIAGNLIRVQVQKDLYMYLSIKAHYEVPRYEYNLVLLFYALALIPALIGRKLITTNPPDVKESIQVEEKIIDTRIKHD